MRLSRYFENKWLKFMGFKPDSELIEEFARQGICVQKGRSVWCDNRRIVVPTMKWNFKQGILYVIDDEKEEFITFYAG